MRLIESETNNINEILYSISEKEMICLASTPSYDVVPCFTAIKICEEIHTKGKVLYVTFEISKKVIEEEILKINPNVDFNNIEIVDKIDINVDEIIYIIEKDTDIKYLIIDDINCLRTTKSYSDIVYKLKKVVLSSKLIIFASFVLHRNVKKDIEKRSNRKFVLSDIDRSGLDHRDFDKIIFLYRDDKIKYELINMK